MAQEEAQAEDQVEAQAEDQAEAQAETMAEAMAEDHLETLLEIPQEMNQGETTLGATMSLMTRIRTTIQRTMRTEAIPLHQGELQPPQAITGTNSIPQHGEPTHPGQKPQVKECQKSTTTPSMNAFMKPFRMQLATYSDGHQSLLVCILKNCSSRHTATNL